MRTLLLFDDNNLTKVDHFELLLGMDAHYPVPGVKELPSTDSCALTSVYTRDASWPADKSNNIDAAGYVSLYTSWVTD